MNERRVGDQAERGEPDALDDVRDHREAHEASDDHEREGAREEVRVRVRYVAVEAQHERRVVREAERHRVDPHLGEHEPQAAQLGRRALQAERPAKRREAFELGAIGPPFRLVARTQRLGEPRQRALEQPLGHATLAFGSTFGRAGSRNGPSARSADVCPVGVSA